MRQGGQEYLDRKSTNSSRPPHRSLFPPPAQLTVLLGELIKDLVFVYNHIAEVAGARAARQFPDRDPALSLGRLSGPACPVFVQRFFRIPTTVFRSVRLVVHRKDQLFVLSIAGLGGTLRRSACVPLLVHCRAALLKPGCCILMGCLSLALLSFELVLDPA